MKRIKLEENSTSNNKIINEKKATLQYLEEKYEILIKYEEISNEYFIYLNAKKENAIVNFTFETRMKYEDFENLQIDPILLKLYDTIDKIFFFLTDAISEKKIYIDNISRSELTLSITTKLLGFSEPLIVELNLKRKDCDIYETVKMLCEKVNQLEKENKLLQFKLNNKIFRNEEELNFIKNRIKQIPKYNDKNISFQLIFRLTENGSNISTFRKICNNIPNNLVLVKTTGGERFGGFTQLAWTSSGQNKRDDEAFCFSLTKNKIYNIIKGFDAIGDYSNGGPAFLNNIFYVGYAGNGSLIDGSCIKNGRSNYSGEKSVYEINNGNQYFTLNEFEFYQILNK